MDSQKLYDEDGIDGPFERAMSRLPKERLVGHAIPDPKKARELAEKVYPKRIREMGYDITRRDVEIAAQLEALAAEVEELRLRVPAQKEALKR